MKIENPVEYITKTYHPADVAVALNTVLTRKFRPSPKQIKLLAGRNGGKQFLGTLPVVTLQKIITFLDTKANEKSQ